MAEGNARRLAGRMIAWSRYFIIVAVVGMFAAFVQALSLRRALQGRSRLT